MRLAKHRFQFRRRIFDRLLTLAPIAPGYNAMTTSDW